MFSSKMVIQKINLDTSSVQLYQNYNLTTPWSFESFRPIAGTDKNPEIFPFVFDDIERFHIGSAGTETMVHRTKEGNLLFSDDYAVPEGFVISILFPKGFVPEVFKFKDKPFIPTGVGLHGASMQPPGHFDVYINQKEQRSAIVFLITSSTYFGFKCIAKNHKNDFPSKDRFPFYDDLFASIGFEESHPIKISSDDLNNYKEHFIPQANLEKVAEQLNELIMMYKENTITVKSKATITKNLQKVLSTSSSAVTIVDSYKTGSSVSMFISKVIAFLSL